MSACVAGMLVRVDLVEALDRAAVRVGMRAEDALDHAAARVEDDVHRALEAAHRRHLVDVRAHRAGVGAVVRLRRGDERAVVRLDRLVGDDAREDQLAAAARAPVVRLRLADRDLQVALGDRGHAARPACRARRRRRTCTPRRSAGRSGGTGSRAAPSGRGSRGRSSARCPTRTSGRPCRSRTRRRPACPAASIASKTAGSSRDCGVGRNWLSITTATLVAPGEQLGEARPGDRRLERRPRRLGRVADRLGLVGIDRGEQVRVGDLELELLAVDLRLVARGADRQRVERLVRDLQLRHAFS